MCSDIVRAVFGLAVSLITGSMGLASSGNIDPTGKNPSMFEPTHGSAPDIVGKEISNPMAQILTAGIMLSHLGENESANELENSVKKVIFTSSDIPRRQFNG